MLNTFCETWSFSKIIWDSEMNTWLSYCFSLYFFTLFLFIPLSLLLNSYCISYYHPLLRSHLDRQGASYTGPLACCCILSGEWHSAPHCCNGGVFHCVRYYCYWAWWCWKNAVRVPTVPALLFMCSIVPFSHCVALLHLCCQVKFGQLVLRWFLVRLEFLRI